MEIGNNSLHSAEMKLRRGKDNLWSYSYAMENPTYTNPILTLIEVHLNSLFQEKVRKKSLTLCQKHA